MKILNKKGFTLVELLAVIVILAIVAGITLVTVLPALKDSRQKAFEISAQTAANYLEKRYELYTIGMDTGEPTIEWQNVTRENTDISNEQLIAAGLKPENYISAKWNITNGRAYVTLSASTKTTESKNIKNLNQETKAGEYYDAKITDNNMYSIAESTNTSSIQPELFGNSAEKLENFIEEEYQRYQSGESRIIKDIYVDSKQAIKKAEFEKIASEIGLNSHNYVKSEYYINQNSGKVCATLYAHTNSIKKANEKTFIIPNYHWTNEVYRGDYYNFENTINTDDPITELGSGGFWINIYLPGKPKTSLNVNIKTNTDNEKIASFFNISIDEVDAVKKDIAREYLKIRIKSSGCD